MAECEFCGNDYDKPMEIIKDGVTYTFDSFECAIQAIAPVCSHCKLKIIGHGVEANGNIYCCADCARHSGVEQVKDRIESTT